MKKFLKILLVVVALLLLVAAFYGYHFYRAKSLEKMRYSDTGAFATDAENAVNMLIYSMKLDKGIKCEPLLKRLIGENLNDYMEAGMAADIYRSDTILDSHVEMERDDLGRTSIAEYKKKRDTGCFDKVNSVILKENADSLYGSTCNLFTLLPSEDVRQEFYVGKRRNGIVTECEIYYRYLNDFREPVNPESVQRIELDSVSGKIVKFISEKEHVSYKIRKLYESFSYDPFLYHSESGKNIGFYKRSFDYNGNLQTVRYGTNFYEVNEKHYYENGKLIKETSKEDRFYYSLRSRMRLFDSTEKEILDSSFYEKTFLPGTRLSARSDVTKRQYENGKIKKDEHYEETFKRPLSFMFSPMKSEKIKEVKNLKFEYDQMGTLKSMVDVLHGNRVFFSKEMQDSLPMCSDDIFRYWRMKKCEKGMENSIQMKPWMPK